MLKPLLRVLPSLSGNVKLACTLLDYIHADKNEDPSGKSVFYTNVRGAKFEPITSGKFIYDIRANLNSSTYAYDINKFYNKYSDEFWRSSFSFLKDDLMKYDISESTQITDSDFEWGVKRLSYQTTDHQCEFFAPIYVEGIDDMPEYFVIKIELFSHNEFQTKPLTKYIKVNIKELNNLGKSNYKNHLYNYLEAYLSQIDNNVIFCMPKTGQATLYGIDVKNGGFVNTVDNKIKTLYKDHNTINNFDAIVCNAFKRNSVVMKQILPLSFIFNIKDVLTAHEISHLYYSNSRISGYYIYNNGVVADQYDFNINYDNFKQPIYALDEYNKYLTWQNVDKNIMNVGNPSLYESTFVKYRYSNKITPTYTRWKLKYSSDEHPYITNMSYAFSYAQNEIYRYGLFPRVFSSSSALALNYINRNGSNIIANSLYLPYKEFIDSLENDMVQGNKNSVYVPIYDKYDALVNQYKLMMNKYATNWFTPVPSNKFYSIFDDNTEWATVDDGKAYYRGILYNLNLLYEKFPIKEKIVSEDFGAQVTYIGKSAHRYYINTTESDFSEKEYFILVNGEMLQILTFEEFQGYVLNTDHDTTIYEKSIVANSEDSTPEEMTDEEIADYENLKQWGMVINSTKVIDEKENETEENQNIIPEMPHIDKFGVFCNFDYLNVNTSSSNNKYKFADHILYSNFSEYATNHKYLPNCAIPTYITNERELVFITEPTQENPTYQKDDYFRTNLVVEEFKDVDDTTRDWNVFVDLGANYVKYNRYIEVNYLNDDILENVDDVWVKYAIFDAYEQFPIYNIEHNKTILYKLFAGGETPKGSNTPIDYIEPQHMLDLYIARNGEYVPMVNVIQNGKETLYEKNINFENRLTSLGKYENMIYRKSKFIKEQYLKEVLTNKFPSDSTIGYNVATFFEQLNLKHILESEWLDYNGNKPQDEKLQYDDWYSKIYLGIERDRFGNITKSDLHKVAKLLFNVNLKKQSCSIFETTIEYEYLPEYIRVNHGYAKNVMVPYNSIYGEFTGENISGKMNPSGLYEFKDYSIIYVDDFKLKDYPSKFEPLEMYAKFIDIDHITKYVDTMNPTEDAAKNVFIRSAALSTITMKPVFEYKQFAANRKSLKQKLDYLSNTTTPGKFKTSDGKYIELVYKGKFYPLDKYLFNKMQLEKFVSVVDEINNSTIDYTKITQENDKFKYNDVIITLYDCSTSIPTKLNVLPSDFSNVQINAVEIETIDLQLFSPEEIDDYGDEDITYGLTKTATTDDNICLNPLFDVIYIEPNIKDRMIYREYVLNNISKVNFNNGEDTLYRFNKNNLVCLVPTASFPDGKYINKYIGLAEDVTPTYYKIIDTTKISLTDDTDNVQIFDNLHVKKVGDTVYGYYMFNITINNTYNFLNMIDHKYDEVKSINYINGKEITIEYLESILPTLLPFANIDLYLLLNSIQTPIIPNMYNIPITHHGIWDNKEYNTTDIFVSKKNVNSMLLLRYFDNIVPYIVKTNKFDDYYMLKYKNSDNAMLVTGKYNEFGDSPIFKQTVYTNTYPGVVVMNNIGSDSNDYLNTFAMLKNQGYTISYPFEYKYYQDNKIILTEEHIEIPIFTKSQPVSWEQIIKAESIEYVKKAFSNYIDTKTNNSLTDNKKLFLFKKYNVKYDTMCVGTNGTKSYKVYTLTLIFDLI